MEKSAPPNTTKTSQPQPKLTLDLGDENYENQAELQGKRYTDMLDFVKSYEKTFEEIEFQLHDNMADLIQLQPNMASLFDPEINDNVCTDTTNKLQSMPQTYGAIRGSYIGIGGMEQDYPATEHSPRSALSQMSPEQIDEEYEKMVQHLKSKSE